MKIPLAGVIGHPISHSRSPRLFAHWFENLGKPGHYIPMDVEHDDLPQMLKTLPKLGFRGLNVTIPHKEAVLALADHRSPTADRLGAANTLTFQEDRTVHADNTDGFGFMENLRQAVPDWQPNAGPVAVFGAGGACRAILAALLDAGAPEIRLTNRTKERAENLSQLDPKRIQVVDWDQPQHALSEATTVVNTTSLGMNGGDFPVDLSALNSKALATDLVYTPLDTAFLKKASAQGCETVDGLGMLLYQALPGCERWFGFRPEITEETRNAVLAG